MNNLTFRKATHAQCTHQVVRVVNFIKAGLRSKKSTAMLILDCERAFDTVWHHELIHKLLVMGFPIYLCKIVLSFLWKRIFQVKVNHHLSNEEVMPAGVPQASTLSHLPNSQRLFFSSVCGWYRSSYNYLSGKRRWKASLKWIEKHIPLL